MIALVVRVVVLALAVHARWPEYDVAHVVAVSFRAADVERDAGVSAELLVAIAQHESDFEPCAVSYVAGGTRRDTIAPRCEVSTRYPQAVVAGYLQAMFASHGPATRELRRDGAMAAGGAELAEWLGTCRGDVACALRGHAGGTRCALDARACSDAQRAFVRIFIERAAELSRLEDSTGEI